MRAGHDRRVDIVNLLAPISLLIALGAVVQRVGLLEEGVVSGLNQLLYWVGLPAAVFYSLAVAPPSEASAGGIAGTMAVGTLIMVAGSWWWARGLGVPGPARGTFTQAAFRGNLSFVGLPLLLTVPGVPTAPAVLALAPMLVLYNALAVTVLVGSQEAVGWRMLRPILKEIARNPIIGASVVGAAWYTSGWSLGVAAERTLGALAKMTLPLALLTIGAALRTVPHGGNRRWVVAAAVAKTVVSPLVGYGVGRAWGLEPGEMLAVMLCMTCPTAVISYTMVRQMGGDGALAATTILWSAVLALPMLALVLAWFGG